MPNPQTVALSPRRGARACAPKAPAVIPTTAKAAPAFHARREDMLLDAVVGGRRGDDSDSVGIRWREQEPRGQHSRGFRLYYSHLRSFDLRSFEAKDEYDVLRPPLLPLPLSQPNPPHRPRLSTPHAALRLAARQARPPSSDNHNEIFPPSTIHPPRSPSGVQRDRPGESGRASCSLRSRLGRDRDALLGGRDVDEREYHSSHAALPTREREKGANAQVEVPYTRVHGELA